MTATPETAVPAPAPVLVPVVGSSRPFPVRRIYCVGRNYAEHAIEMGHSGREAPFFFMKPADAVVFVAEGSTTTIPYPSSTRDLHHEVELVVALGSGGHALSVEAAQACVFGYAVGLDLTRRDLQAEAKKAARPWETAKAFEQSAPLGPIHPISRTGWLQKGAITLALDGEERQRGDLSQLIWNVAETIAHLSRFWTLAPGDLIYTGTPAGVGAIPPGSTLTGQIDGVGSLQLHIAATDSAGS